MVIAWLGLALAVGAQQATPAQAGRWIKALSDSRFKVRVEATTQIGKHRVKRAAPVLRRMVANENEHESVRAAAAMSLAKLGDEKSRSQFAYLVGHKSQLIAKSAEKALILLDRAKPQTPYFLVEVENVRLPDGASTPHGKRVLKKLKHRLNNTGGVVRGAGEYSVLKEQELASHLEQRKLTGVLFKPELVELKSKVEGGRTVFFAKVSISGYSLVNKRREFTVGGEASSWIDGTDLASAEQRDLENEVLDGSTDSATLQALQQMSNR